jgi:hypothetical protein
MARSWKKEAEAQLRTAKIIDQASSNMSDGFKNVTGKVIDFTKALTKSYNHLEAVRVLGEQKAKHDANLLTQQDSRYKHEKDMFDKKKILDAQTLADNIKVRMAELSHQKLIADNRNKNRIETEQVHGENVRHNLKMRQLYKDQSQSLSNVMNLMTGMSGRGAAMGGISTAFNTFSLGSEIVGTNTALDEAREEQRIMRLSGQSMDPAFEIGWKKVNRRIERLLEVRTEQREKLGVFGGFGGSGEEDSKWAKRLEPIMSWAKKNKSGIIISAASIGMMYMVFKKLLSVSPMLQKMLEVMGLAFNLVLRPFGDFIGFILRPIAMNMLALVMPFFKEAYPFLMKLGSAMGEKFAVGDILGALGLMFEAIHPFDVLKWIFGDREGNTEGGIGAVGAVLSAGVLGLFSAVVVSIYKMTGWVRAFLGLKPIPTVTPTPNITSVVSSAQASSGSGSPKDLRGVNWKDGKISGSTFLSPPQPNQKVNQLQIIKDTIDDVIKNLKFGKLNSLASIRGGTGGTAFMVSQLLDYVPEFKEFRLGFMEWQRDMSGANDPSNAWKGIDQYGQGIGVPDYSQQHPFAHNVDSTGTPINININIDNVENASDVDYLMNEMIQEMESSNYIQAGN